jgi:hypothetical protein
MFSPSKVLPNFLSRRKHRILGEKKRRKKKEKNPFTSA